MGGGNSASGRGEVYAGLIQGETAPGSADPDAGGAGAAPGADVGGTDDHQHDGHLDL